MDQRTAESDARAVWAMQAGLLEELLDVPSAEGRAALLEARTQGTPELRAGLERMLEAHYTAAGFLPMADLEVDGAVDLSAQRIGERIGPFNLREKLGEGGCGVVYLAEQEKPIRRRVALKIIKLGMDTRSVIARFEAERQTLAILNHPSIAKVIDAGATQSGRPFFVMELVEGPPITRFCDDNRLGLSERLGLFLQVCSAVQHAHQKGILHRDLKPSNILVANLDGTPVPKVIDFGVAKAMTASARDGTVFTQGAQFIGTPAYMSPEQASLDSDVDTRADVYALGVLLYELLTGEPPFDPKELVRLGFDEMCRTIRERQPVRPGLRLSERIQRDTGENGRVANSFYTALIQKRSHLGDLDWIVMKCLEKDRARRYAGASALAADVQRFLRHEPVTARPPSALYLAQKAFRRHRLICLAGASTVVALLTGILLTSWQAVRAVRAEKESAVEKQIAQKRLDASLEFVNEMLRDVHPAFSDLVGARAAREVFLKSAMRLLPQLSGDAQQSPKERLLLAALHLQLGYAQGWYIGPTAGDFQAALNSVFECIRLVHALPDHGDSENYLLVRAHMVALQALRELGKVDDSLHHVDQVSLYAEKLSRSGDPKFRDHGGAYGHWAFAMRGVLLFDRGSFREALEVAQAELEAVLAREQDGSANHEWDISDLTNAHEGLGIMLLQVKNYGEAVRHYLEGHRLAQLQTKRQPNQASVAARAIFIQARLGQALLSSGEWERGRNELASALALAEDLVQRDPESAGFKKLKFEVLLAQAHGMAAWGITEGNPRGNLDAQTAREALAGAEALFHQLPGVPPFLKRDLDQARVAVAQLPY